MNVEELLDLYKDITNLNKKLDEEVAKLNLNDFTEFQTLKKPLKVYLSKWVR